MTRSTIEEAWPREVAQGRRSRSARALESAVYYRRLAAQDLDRARRRAADAGRWATVEEPRDVFNVILARSCGRSCVSALNSALHCLARADKLDAEHGFVSDGLHVKEGEAFLVHEGRPAGEA